MSDDRPTFTWNDKPVRAAGILLWTHKGDTTYRLFRKINNKFEDIGGKTDVADRCTEDTAIREVCEETNGKLFSATHTYKDCEATLRQLMQQHYDVEYNAKSKYILFKIQVDPTILDIPMRRFGLSERTDWGTLRHYYQWRTRVPPQYQLHWRIRRMAL